MDRTARQRPEEIWRRQWGAVELDAVLQIQDAWRDRKRWLAGADAREAKRGARIIKILFREARVRAALVLECAWRRKMAYELAGDAMWQLRQRKHGAAAVVQDAGGSAPGPMGVEDNALAKILQEEEDLCAAHELASTDKRHWNPASTAPARERSNNTSGLLTGPEYSSDDIGDGPSNVRASAIGHELVVLEQGAAFRRIELGGQPRRADRRIDIPPDTVIDVMIDVARRRRRRQRKYRINRKIGSGSFSKIYSATVIDQDSNQQVAIKFENRPASSLQLKHEFKVYRELRGCTGIGRVMYYGTYRDRKFGVDCNVMVMELLGGPSLEDLFNYCGRRFSLKTTLQLADKLLERAETLHENHLIHRDITPANFVVSPGETAAEVFCIDFGLSKRYRHPQTLQHIPYREDRSLTGTRRYASVAKHQGKEASRRDDLESIGYMLVYFLLGRLPWQGLVVPSFDRGRFPGIVVSGLGRGTDAGTASLKDRLILYKKTIHRLILDKKTTIPLSELCRGCPVEFQEFIQYCRELGFDEKPKMNYVRNLFRGLYRRHGFENPQQWDWDTRPRVEVLRLLTLASRRPRAEVLRLMILGSQGRRGKYIRSLDFLVRCPPDIAWHVLSYWPCVWYSWFGRTAGHGVQSTVPFSRVTAQVVGADHGRFTVL